MFIAPTQRPVAETPHIIVTPAQSAQSAHAAQPRTGATCDTYAAASRLPLPKHAPAAYQSSYHPAGRLLGDPRARRKRQSTARI